MEEFVLINSTFNMSKLKTRNYKEPGLAIKKKNIYIYIYTFFFLRWLNN